MAIPFSAEPKSINELFGRDMTYIIPEYQRPYSWECIGRSDRNNQVNVMWDDLFNHFKNDRTDKNDYFFGSIVLIDKKKQGFDVIDGQQRLTTTILLFVAIKSFLSEIKPSTKSEEVKNYVDETIRFIDDVIYNKKRHGASLIQKKLKIEKSYGFEYDEILSEVIAGKELISDKLVGKATQEQKKVISRFIENRNYFKEKLKIEFTDKGKFKPKNIEELDNFIEFLKSKVSVVRILASDFDIAYHVFEILNNRGLPLSNKDLFRNFIIKEFDILKKSKSTKYSDIDPNNKWNRLENTFEISDDFIGRWVESYKAAQPKSSAFNDLKEIYKNDYKKNSTKEKIELFYDDIKRDLKYYTNIINNEIENHIVQSKIKFIINAPNLRYGINFLLALAKHFKGLGDKTINYLNAYELYLIHSLLNVRFNYGPVYNSIEQLNIGNASEALKILTGGYNVSDISDALNKDMPDNETAKLLIAKYVWIGENKTKEDVVDQKLLFEKATLEHIIPQEPEEGTNWYKDFTRDFRKEYIYKLGNMTLLTNRMNSGAKNYDFSTKQEQYTKTKLPITHELSVLKKITEKYVEERHKKIIAAICTDLGI